MKKFIVFAVVVALLLPAAAFAKSEFDLGGFIKLDSFWDSSQQGKNINGVIARNNDPNFHHGAMRFTAQGSRFNFTIKGPKVWGAQTTAFIEMDFDQTNGPDAATTSSVYTPRMRHAMFRLNWPETELLMGQYWSMFCNWYAEAAEDGPLQVTGTPTARIPQIRLTQKFLGDWSVAGLIGNANSVFLTNNTPYSANSDNGMAAETPQIQGSLKYNHDWWGKAAYYGVPTPFTAQITAGWQRSVARSTTLTAGGLGLANLNGQPIPNVANARINNSYVDPWMVMGTLFIPVIPTHSANLAGTAHIMAQYWIGQGVGSFGFNGDATALFRFENNILDATNLYDIELLKRWGGFVEAQYFFTNQWYLNAAYALSRVYDIDQSANNRVGQDIAYNGLNNQMKGTQQVDVTLWYRPVQALKFGLQYAYIRSDFLTNLTTPAVSGNTTNWGDAHRVEFVGYFFF